MLAASHVLQDAYDVIGVVGLFDLCGQGMPMPWSRGGSQQTSLQHGYLATGRSPAAPEGLGLSLYRW